MEVQTESKIAVMANEISNIKLVIDKIDRKLDTVFVTKTELQLLEQRIQATEKTTAKLWGAIGTLALMVIGEIIRLVSMYFFS